MVNESYRDRIDRIFDHLDDVVDAQMEMLKDSIFNAVQLEDVSDAWPGQPDLSTMKKLCTCHNHAPDLADGDESWDYTNKDGVKVHTCVDYDTQSEPYNIMKFMEKDPVPPDGELASVWDLSRVQNTETKHGFDFYHRCPVLGGTFVRLEYDHSRAGHVCHVCKGEFKGTEHEHMDLPENSG